MRDHEDLAHATRRWRIAAPAALTWREWDGEYVVRDERTGNTHLLDARAGSVLACLVAKSAGMSVAQIAAAFPAVSGNVQFDSDIEAVLFELERIGLATAEHM